MRGRMNTFKGMVNQIIQNWWDDSSGNSRLCFELFLARHCKFRDSWMEKACTAQVKHSLSKHWQFATNFAGRQSKPLFPFSGGDCCSKAALCVCVWVSEGASEALQSCPSLCPTLAQRTNTHLALESAHARLCFPQDSPRHRAAGGSSRRIQAPSIPALPPSGAVSPSLSHSISLPGVLRPCPAHPRRSWTHSFNPSVFSLKGNTIPLKFRYKRKHR